MHERLLALEALGALTLTSFALRCLPRPWLGMWVEGAMDEPRLPDGDPTTSVRRVSQGVQRVSARLTSASCLAQALAGRLMLERRGIPSQIEIGVKLSEGRLTAHAWLLVGGKTVLGGQTSDAPFAALRRAP